MILKDRFRGTKLRQCEGAAMVEFAIGVSVLLMLVLGIIEFGFLWYQKQVITNASREAARYGVTYQTTSTGARLAPQSFTNPTIVGVVDQYCANRIPTGSWTTAVTGSGYSTGTKGSPVIVTVTCTNQMDILSGFIPSLANLSFTAQTIMNCE